LLLLTIRLITGVVGIAEFGIVMFANRVAQFAGIAINFGTNQSAVRDTAINLNDQQKLASVFYNTVWIRALVFVITLTLLLCLRNAGVPYYNTILMATPIVLAEVFNPLCFFIGVEKLKIFNVYNLIFNFIAVLALVLFINAVIYLSRFRTLFTLTRCMYIMLTKHNGNATAVKQNIY